MNRDRGTLLHIAIAARRVMMFSRGMSLDEFAEDIRTQFAVLHQLMVIGEAVKRLSDSFRDEHTAIPWSSIAGMRDNLIHGYDNINLDSVWDAVERDVPQLLQYVEPLLPKEDK